LSQADEQQQYPSSRPSPSAQSPSKPDQAGKHHRQCTSSVRPRQSAIRAAAPVWVLMVRIVSRRTSHGFFRRRIRDSDAGVRHCGDAERGGISGQVSLPTIKIYRSPQGKGNADSVSRAAKFASLTSLTLFFPGNTSQGEEDTTQIYYIGLRGKWTPVSPDHRGVSALWL